MKKSLMYVVLIVFSLLSGGCFSPGFVRMLDKPVAGQRCQFNSKKVALVVRDIRPDAVKKANMCGVNHQTAFMIPAAPLFLAHAERLDSIVVNHAKTRLEAAGYEVVASYPEARELSRTKVSAGTFAAHEKEAWAAKDSQDVSASERKQIKKAGKSGSAQVSGLGQAQVSAWDKLVDATSADAVVEIQISKFWTHYSYYGSCSWMTANLAVCSPDDELRKVLYGSQLKGGGYMFSFFTPLTPSSDATASMNTAYWFVLNKLENEFSSPSLFSAIVTAGTVPESVVVVEEVVAQAAAPVADISVQLEKLKELKDAGLLGDAEFEAKRLELIEQL